MGPQPSFLTILVPSGLEVLGLWCQIVQALIWALSLAGYMNKGILDTALSFRFPVLGTSILMLVRSEHRPAGSVLGESLHIAEGA